MAEETKTTNVIDPIEKALGKMTDKLESQIAVLNESAKKVLEGEYLTKAQLAEELASKTPEEKANLEAGGMLSAITDLKVWDIPVGEAAIGGFAAVFASELIDGFLINQSDQIKGVIKLVGAGAAVKWGGKVFGSTGSKALAILLAYDGIRSVLPIDTYAKKLADSISGAIPLGGLGGFKKNVEQTRKVTSGKGDYYAGLKGGM